MYVVSPQKGSWAREISLFQGNLGWWGKSRLVKYCWDPRDTSVAWDSQRLTGATLQGLVKYYNLARNVCSVKTENKEVDFSMAIVSYLRPIVTPFFVEKGFQKHQEVSFFFHLDFFKKNTSWRNKNISNNHNINDTVDGRNPAPPGMYKTP